MKKLDAVAAILVVIGGLNWGLVGVAGFDLVSTLFGSMSAMSRVVYALVGIAAAYEAIRLPNIQRRWSGTPSAARI